jgi:hypothetical protein
MAVLIEEVFPAGITIDLIDAVTDNMDVDAKLPPGGFIHLHFERDGRVNSVDVWDSVEAHDLFVESTLMPVLGKLAAARGIELSRFEGPEVKVTQIHRLVR